MIAFDTNVLIYACDRMAGRRHEVARDLLSSSRDGVILWQVAVEFIAAFRKVGGQDGTQEAWEYLQEFRDLLPLILPRSGVLDRARILHIEGKWSFWDALITAACLEAGVTRLYTEDLPGCPAPPPLEIINPFA